MTKWFAKQDRYSATQDQSIHSYTITTNANYDGWETDGGCNGYGLPKELAQWICDQLNKSDEIPPYETTWDAEWKKK